MNKKIYLSIARDFSEIPGARYPEEGDFSGQEFRNHFLVPKIQKAIEQKCMLVIDLDGTAGYGTSFLEEAFGGLIRIDGFTFDQLEQVIHFESNEDAEYINEIKGYMKDAQAKKNNN